MYICVLWWWCNINSWAYFPNYIHNDSVDLLFFDQFSGGNFDCLLDIRYNNLTLSYTGLSCILMEWMIFFFFASNVLNEYCRLTIVWILFFHSYVDFDWNIGTTVLRYDSRTLRSFIQFSLKFCTVLQICDKRPL